MQLLEKEQNSVTSCINLLYEINRFVIIQRRGGRGSEWEEPPCKQRWEDTVRSILNGMEYQVKKIVEKMLVLESQDGKKQILTDLDNLTLFYKKEGDKAL
jgi:hypothetical protein